MIFSCSSVEQTKKLQLWGGDGGGWRCAHVEGCESGHWQLLKFEGRRLGLENGAYRGRSWKSFKIDEL